MNQSKREKSAKYPGVYWRVDASSEKTYYIRYRLGGRGSKEIEEPVGKSSAGMTEAKASIIRADRMRGKEASNKERRKNLSTQNSETFTLRSAWEAYSEINSERSLYKTDRCLLKYFKHLLDKPVKDIQTSDIDAIRNNDNDILAACVGVCLANGTDDTKALARYITEKPCAEDGFSDFVRRHLL